MFHFSIHCIVKNLIINIYILRDLQVQTLMLLLLVVSYEVQAYIQTAYSLKND